MDRDGTGGGWRGGSTSFCRFLTLPLVTLPAQGNNEHYNELVGQFRAISGSATAFSSTYPPSSSTATTTPSNKEQPTQQTLKLWMEALIHVVAQLDRSHSVLIDSIISLPWTTMDESLVNTYTRFVQALLTSRSEFVAMTLEKIVKGFRFREFHLGDCRRVACNTLWWLG